MKPATAATTRRGAAVAVLLAASLPWCAAAVAAPARVDGGLDLAVEFTPANELQRTAGVPYEQAQPLWNSIQTLRLGWRYRMPDQVALAAARPDLRRDLGDATFTKVGIEWKPAQSRIDFLRGGLGLRLDGLDHMSIRLRKGSFGIYLNRRF